MIRVIEVVVMSACVLGWVASAIIRALWPADEGPFEFAAGEPGPTELPDGPIPLAERRAPR